MVIPWCVLKTGYTHGETDAEGKAPTDQDDEGDALKRHSVKERRHGTANAITSARLSRGNGAAKRFRRSCHKAGHVVGNRKDGVQWQTEEDR